MIDYLGIIKRYYTEGSDAYKLLVTHSSQVAELAMALLDGKPELVVDRDFVYEAAMLHDIGMFRTHAPSIYCYGNLPYLQHGVEGRKILDSLGLEKHGLVCERHTGAGLTAQEIVEQHLPLEPHDMLPITLEEKLVCYADNFYSKSHVAAAKKLDKVMKSMSKFGPGTIGRLNEMVALFGSPDGLGM